MPSDKTTQGEFPNEEITSIDSPIPKILNPNIKMKPRLKSDVENPISHVCAARHGVMGMLLCGFSKFIKLIIQLGTVKL